MANRLLTVREVTEVLAIGKTKSYELIWQGRIPSVRIDGAVRVPASGLEDFIASLPSAGIPTMP